MEKLPSMASKVSSFKSNMPTVEGVFPEGEQPNMPSRIGKKIAEFTNIFMPYTFFAKCG